MEKGSSASKTPNSSSNPKSVFLREWWLIKVDKMESKLGVGGYTNKETLKSRSEHIFRSASRYNPNKNENETQLYNSAPIVRRLDNNTLESVDGTIITITGFLNKSWTLSNGFSPQVCNVFLYGFPFNWEDAYASAKSFHDESCSAKKSFPESFVDLPVTYVRDLLMYNTDESEDCALNSILIRDMMNQISTLQQTPATDSNSDDEALSEDEDDIQSHATIIKDMMNQVSILQQTSVNPTTDTDDKASSEDEDGYASNSTKTLSSGGKQEHHEKASSEHEDGFTSNATTTISSASKRKNTTSPKRYTLRRTQARKKNT